MKCSITSWSRQSTVIVLTLTLSRTTLASVRWRCLWETSRCSSQLLTGVCLSSSVTSPPPKCISVSSPSHKTLPSAQVAPMVPLRPKDKFHLLPEKADEGEYVIPDDDKPNKLNFGEYVCFYYCYFIIGIFVAVFCFHGVFHSCMYFEVQLLLHNLCYFNHSSIKLLCSFRRLILFV